MAYMIEGGGSKTWLKSQSEKKKKKQIQKIQKNYNKYIWKNNRDRKTKRKTYEVLFQISNYFPLPFLFNG